MNKTAKPIRVLHFSSTKKDNCGVGKYQEACVDAMVEAGVGVENTFFEVSPYQTREMSPAELEKTMERLKEELKDYDILHIQHEFGLFWQDEVARVVEAGKAAGKKVVFTIHLSPSFVKELDPVRLGGLGPHSVMDYLRKYRHHRAKMNLHVVPMRRADLIIVHNTVTQNALIALGIDPSRIRKFIHPVDPIANPPVTHNVEKWLNKKDGDVILCMAGFLHKYKGTLAAVEALKFLPSNYKLLLAGSVKGDSIEMSYEDEVADVIDAHNLKDRVYITGYIKSDEYLNSLIRESDICVFPYDKVYYGSASSGALGLAFTNCKPIIAYPTETIKEAAKEVEGSVVLCQTFAYYELAREVKNIDLKRQSELSRQFAEKMAWPQQVGKIVEFYKEILT
ncbi:MAG: glycosyltransferase [Candidatus Saccharibacteria bacterium]